MNARGAGGGVLSLLAALTVAGYFLLHGLTGEAGLAAWTETRRELARLDAEHERLALQRAALEDRARRLREATLDLDFLEERARDLAMVARPDEIIIPAEALTAARAPVDPDAARVWGRPASAAARERPRTPRIDAPGDHAYTAYLAGRP